MLDVYSKFLSFSVVRNPWDQAISAFYWSKVLKNNKQNENNIEEQRGLFLDFLKNNPKRIKKNEKIIFHPKQDKLLVDKVIKYERLKVDLRALQNKLGIKEDLYALAEEASAKTGFRPSKKEPFELYTDETASIVLELCKRQIEAFSYERPF